MPEQFQPNPSDRDSQRRFTFADLGQDGLHITPATDEEIAKITSHEERVLKQALEAVPSREDGLDMDRIQSFFDELGLRVDPIRVIDPSDVKKFKKSMSKVGFSHPGLDALHGGPIISSHTLGMHFGELGMSVVVRRPEIETINGPGYTESFIVHELAHSTSQYHDVIAQHKRFRKITYVQGRSGSVVKSQNDVRGAFFEEGFAELIAGDFTVNKLGLRYGVWDLEDWEPEVADERIPSKYYWKGLNMGEALYSKSAIAATGLEEMERLAPGLKDALIKSRANVEGLREVAQMTESIQPGLYNFLSRLQNNDDDFMDALKHIRSLH